MKKPLFLILISFLLIFFESCTQKQKIDIPLVFTGEVTNVTDTSALFSARVTNNGTSPIVESGFIWGVHPGDNNGIKLKNTDNPSRIYSLKNNVTLLPGLTYYVRAYLQSESVTTYGKEVSFESRGVQKVNTGQWTHRYEDPEIQYGGGCEYSGIGFWLNGLYYIPFLDGNLYRYNPVTNQVSYVLTNNLLQWANYSATYDGKAYVFSKDSFYLFDPQQKTFSKLAALTQNVPKYGITGFIIGDNIYIGLGCLNSLSHYYKDFWKYNITANTWQQIESFPGDYRNGAFSFSLRNSGYVGGGANLLGSYPYPILNDLWRYDSQTGHWTKKESFPVGGLHIYGTNTQNYGYCFAGKVFYEYNPEFDLWEKMADPGTTMCAPYLFSRNNTVYAGHASNVSDSTYLSIWAFNNQ